MDSLAQITHHYPILAHALLVALPTLAISGLTGAPNGVQTISTTRKGNMDSRSTAAQFSTLR